ncbi:uncharacterized protein LOC132842619 isoform X2 [Tachysurus vachellii]|uniref:uncharacterized protein LOC132842619 isoform X2 n=1 Tax=Tachysurus vachellii TaxID=175792 RepID=UPI00296B132D|nr:uncharacterized protein LOC132842619 isoform X2 [Tachysurus vachellii]
MEPPRYFKSKSAGTSPVFSRRLIKRSDSPEASCVYMKSDGSTDPPLNLDEDIKRFLSDRMDHCGISDERSAALNSSLRSNPSRLRNPHLFGKKIKRHSCGERKRSDSLKYIQDSIKSDRSVYPPRNFKSRSARTPPAFSYGERERSDSLNSSWDSINSEVYIDLLRNIRGKIERINRYSYGERKRSDSLNSLKSEWSIDHPWNFSRRSAPISSRYRLTRSQSFLHVYPKKEGSKDPLWNLEDIKRFLSDSYGERKRSDSLNSLKSEWSMDHPWNFSRRSAHISSRYSRILNENRLARSLPCLHVYPKKEESMVLFSIWNLDEDTILDEESTDPIWNLDEDTIPSDSSDELDW